MSTTKSIIRATDLGEFIRYKSCERRFKLGANNRELARQLPFAGKLFATLDPVLKTAGRKRETEWEQYLKRIGFSDLLPYDQRASKEKQAPWSEFQKKVRALKMGEQAFFRELSISAELAAFHVVGSIDFALIVWRQGKPVLRLVECKASRKDQTYHRAQLSIYKMLVEQIMSEESGLLLAGQTTLNPKQIECVVARIDEETNRGQAILEIPAFDLSMIEQDVMRLLQDDGPLQRILQAPLEELNYKIDAKCDDCIFNIHCLPEGARLRKLQLIGADPSTVRALSTSGITSLDNLAQLDLASAEADELHRSGELNMSLELLKAKAFARLSTLPDAPPECYAVQTLSYRIFSQLPEHDIHEQRLIRVYISVGYDYVENRISSISAHVTASDGMLHTGWTKVDGKNQADPIVKERIGRKSQDVSQPLNEQQTPFEERELNGIDLVFAKEAAWTGFYEWDTEAERQMLESFFEALVNGIKESAGSRGHAPVHFYFWSRNEVSKVIEACTRASSSLLGHLRQLLGCRESLEQMIYSCLQDEVNNRYGLGWTGRGLLVASSLSWFAWTYHWHRSVDGVPTWLDRELAQDLFDFKTDLNFKDGAWQTDSDSEPAWHSFEIRSQFNDNLPAGYLHAFWGILPESTDEQRDNERRAIENFRHAARASLLKEYLRARVHALRWIEERMEYKNSALQKPPVILRDLPQFKLQINDPASAAIDFLRLDFHIRFTDWIASHLVAPKDRVMAGRSIGLKNVVCKNGKLFAEINYDNYLVSADDMQIRCRFEEKAFVRVSPCDRDPGEPQTLRQFGRNGITCIIEALDWHRGLIELTVIPLRQADRYRLSSLEIENDSLIFAFATLDDSPSDFVSPRVEKRLASKFGRHACAWFDRTKPSVPAIKPLTDMEMHGLRKLLKSFKPGGNSEGLENEQMKSVLSGLDSTVQLLQGPPGTGKTMTTAVAIIIRILARPAKTNIIFVSANTHTAIDTLLERLQLVVDPLSELAAENGHKQKPVKIMKAESAQAGSSESSKVNSIKGSHIEITGSDDNAITKIRNARREGVVIVGGTVGTLLKLCEKDLELRADMLVIDEASMMVFPSFLALATTTKDTSTIMLAGDHRQLSPILAQDWEKEDRPPTVLYQPYASAYDAVRNLSSSVEASQISMSSLQYTFRLPDAIRRLIARLYKLDDVELQGKASSSIGQNIQPTADEPMDAMSSVWSGETGLFLIAHSERMSRQSNLLESEIIERILEASGELPANSVAIVTPHRAQRAMLQKRLSKYTNAVDLIDTVERLQGGERPTIIFSATVSDPSAISSSVDFILDLNRSNVAFSRAQQRLIVVCSEELLNFIPSSLDQYEEALLWKSLREVCCKHVCSTQIDGHDLRIFSA